MLARRGVNASCGQRHGGAVPPAPRLLRPSRHQPLRLPRAAPVEEVGGVVALAQLLLRWRGGVGCCRRLLQRVSRRCLQAVAGGDAPGPEPEPSLQFAYALDPSTKPFPYPMAMDAQQKALSSIPWPLFYPAMAAFTAVSGAVGFGAGRALPGAGGAGGWVDGAACGADLYAHGRMRTQQHAWHTGTQARARQVPGRSAARMALCAALHVPPHAARTLGYAYPVACVNLCPPHARA